MKKIYLLLLIVTSVGFGQTFSFSGTGALNLAANGWTTHSGTAGQQVIIATTSDSGNSLFRTGSAPSAGNRTSIIAGNGEDVNIPLTAPITTAVYYAVFVKYLDSTTLPLNTTTGEYSLALTSVVSATTTSFHGRIYSKQGATANTVVVGVLNNSGGTAAPSFATTELAINTTHLLVVKYDPSNNTASLFVNPTAGAVEPAASATNATGTTAAPAQAAGFVIRQAGSAAAGTGNVEIDEIRVGTTFAAVTPGAVASVNNNQIAGLKIYPNPVKDGILYIDTQANADKSVTIFDILGKQVVNVSTTANTVNVSSLKDGVYFVKITEADKTATRKLVINN